MKIDRKTITSNVLSFALGFAVGSVTLTPNGTATGEGSDEIGPVDVETSGTETSGTESSGTISLADVPPEARVPSYCATFPERCSIAAPCPDRKVLDDGSVVGGCFLAEYVCCNSEVGCYAVHWAADCVDGGLYWSDCTAGESAIDPDSGKAIIICHD